MRTIKAASFAWATAALAGALAAPAMAQVNPELGDTSRSGSFSTGGDTGGQAQWGGQADTGSPAAATRSNRANPAGDTDHDQFVGSFGVGFFGVMNVPIGPEGSVSAPTIGARYWLSRDLAIEGALGIGIGSNSVRVGGSDAASSSSTAFALHGGVPIVLATAQHFVFQVIPFLDVGFASGSAGVGPAEVDLSGFLLQLGGRVGAEIHFGFIGIPQLALQGTVGLQLSLQNRGVDEPGPNGTTVETRSSDFRLGTTVGNAPWDIFVGNVTAIYYL